MRPSRGLARRCVAAMALMTLMALISCGLAAAASEVAKGGEEFFIVSSLDAARGRIVLKRPTEVTVVMRVTERTAYRGEDGRTLRFADLRAGETGYITFTREPAGDLAATLVRLGPMTVAELHRRYLGPHHP
jgi:hypothetical protein